VSAGAACLATSIPYCSSSPPVQNLPWLAFPLVRGPSLPPYLPSLFSSPSFLGDNQTAATATASSAGVLLLSFLLHLTLLLVLVHILYSPSFIILTCFSNARSCWQTASPGRLSFTHPPTQSPEGPVLSHTYSRLVRPHGLSSSPLLQPLASAVKILS